MRIIVRGKEVFWCMAHWI